MLPMPRSNLMVTNAAAAVELAFRQIIASGLGDSPDATLLHKTLPLVHSGNRLELNSQAELNLPGSSSAEEATNYSEVAAPEGCPW
jgi:hypothetical protein